MRPKSYFTHEGCNAYRKNKQPGIHDAFTKDGVGLPMIDITHPGTRAP
jgi:hypothetical protein